MKLALIDCTNWAILFVGESNNIQKLNWDFNILRACILDTQIHKILPASPIYNRATNINVTNGCFVLERPIGFIETNISEKNSFNISKQNKAQLMFPLIEFLTSCINRRALEHLNVFGLPIDDTLALEVTASNPEADVYTQGICEYANILNITPAQAYQELKLEYETIHSVKLRSYATVKKYQALIRNINTKQQADALYEELNDKLIKETLI